MNEEEKNALHEAGHAAIAWRLAGPDAITGPTSIQPTRRWGAVSFCRGTIDDSGEDVDTSLPAIIWPAAARRAGETEICVLLAGYQAEKLLEPRGGSLYAPPLLRPFEDRLEEATLKLSENDGDCLAYCNESPHDPAARDFPRALETAERLAGKHGAIPLIQYLELETAELVKHLRGQIEWLASALLKHRTLSAAAVVELLDTTPIGA